MLYLSLQITVTDSAPNNPITLDPAPPDWRYNAPPPYFAALPNRPSTKSFLLACALFLLTLCTCLVAGTHFALAYAHNQPSSSHAFLNSSPLLYRHPLALPAAL